MKEFIMNMDELQILLNQERFFDVSFPAYDDFRLIDVSQSEFGYKIKIHQVNFDRIDTSYQGGMNENPSYSDFRECFLGTGLITYANYPELSKKIESYKRIHRKVYFSFDTNVLYNQFLSSSPLKNEQMVLTQTVRDEITKHINHKYNHDQIERLKRNAEKNEILFDVLERRRVKKSRKAKYFALQEMEKLNLIETDSVKYSPEDYEGFDAKIARELHKFQQQTHSLVLLLTADETMQDCCELENIDHLRLLYPKTIRDTEANPAILRKLIFNLSVLFGFIQLGDGVTIYGDFSGKTNLDDMKVHVSSNRVSKEIERDLRVCRRLLALKIEH